MTARDDYPELAALGNAEIEARKALDEIDLLRAALATFAGSGYGPASRSQTERRP